MVIMKIFNLIFISVLLFLDLGCCRSNSCIRIVGVSRNPLDKSIDIIIDKIDDVIELSIKYYCEKKVWPQSKDILIEYADTRSAIKKFDEFNSIKFTVQSNKRLDIYFDFKKFNYDSIEVERYKGFCGIFIQQQELCPDKNYVEINVSDYTAYLENGRRKESGDVEKRKPIDLKMPVIIKFDEFKNRTVDSIQFGYQI